MTTAALRIVLLPIVAVVAVLLPLLLSSRSTCLAYNWPTATTRFGRVPETRTRTVPSPLWGSSSVTQLQASSSASAEDESTPVVVDKLFNAIEVDKERDNKSEIRQLIQQLEDSYVAPPLLIAGSSSADSTTTSSSSSSQIFNKLIGYYNVSYTIKLEDDNTDTDNPVGGKWTKSNGIAQQLLSTKRSMQHVLPTNTTGLLLSSTTNNTQHNNVVAEAINVIILRAFWGLFHVHVLLRGDAIPAVDDPPKRPRSKKKKKKKDKEDDLVASRAKLPTLSNRAVRVYFDPPRIVLETFGKRQLFNLNVGPTSSVVLDTTYVDNDKLRIGMGGTSGTRFVFSKCDETKDTEVKECINQLQLNRLTNKFKFVLGSVLFSVVNIYNVIKNPNLPIKILSSIIALISTTFMGLVVSSSGGIEVGGTSYQAGLSKK